ISMSLGLKGFSHLLSTGCTSSTDAIAYATQMIALGRINRILAGGVDAPLTHSFMLAFCVMKVVTPSWNHEPQRGSRPFSKDRDGFVLAEGAYFFLLEELQHALERGAQIYAEIIGYGSTCDAHHRVRLDETGEEPARAMELALLDAELSPEEIDYVNLHGTSTELNDRIETRAIKKAFGERAHRFAASATKSMVGHPQGASGAAGLTATLGGMAGGFLPPTINLEIPDPECDLDYVPNKARPGNIRHALCNCIGFGSKNSALVIKKFEI
ncbi:MAG: beta-ketoacyl-[acyl-carrier-protein] synthase family protein, partial [Blastocatellia bacterium]|nr:beta-ketoacyl-[acyl-carrier-protein] synthase family protein [Blastocatellia bacterium]